MIRDRLSSLKHAGFLLAAVILCTPLATIPVARAYSQRDAHFGGGACTKCQCDDFQGSGEYCIRTSCKHSYTSHKV
jgi:hypothetical protein